MLTNSQGKELTLLLRQYREGDEEGMIACIRDEYGDTYFKRDFYDPAYLREEIEEGIITVLVAQTQEDGIAGMLLLKQFYPEESMCEIASQIFRKKYRGYGLALPFFEFAMELLLSCTYSAAFCLPVLFHDVTQRLLYRLGLKATGLIMNVFDMEHILHSYSNGKNGKHSQGIQVRALEKVNAGRLYLPEEHRNFCEEIYNNLGVRYQMTGENIGNISFPAHSVIIYKNNELQHSLEIRIIQVGADLAKHMKELHARYPLKDRQTANVFLNINDPWAIWAYRVLWQLGYFFTGLRPLCSEREFMVLHNCGQMDVYFEDYVLSSEFACLVEYINTCYEEQKKAGERERKNGGKKEKDRTKGKQAAAVAGACDDAAGRRYQRLRTVFPEGDIDGQQYDVGADRRRRHRAGPRRDGGGASSGDCGGESGLY